MLSVLQQYCCAYCSCEPALDQACAHDSAVIATAILLLLYRAALSDQLMRMKKGDILWHDHAVCCLTSLRVLHSRECVQLMLVLSTTSVYSYTDTAYVQHGITLA
jgi:hypothetical protein